MKVKIITPGKMSFDEIIDFISLDYRNTLLKFSDGTTPDMIIEFRFTAFKGYHAFILSQNGYRENPIETDYYEIVIIAPDTLNGKHFAEYLCNGSLHENYEKKWKIHCCNWWYPDIPKDKEHYEFVNALKRDSKWYSLLSKTKDINFIYYDIPQNDISGKFPDRITYFDEKTGTFQNALYFRRILPGHRIG